MSSASADVNLNYFMTEESSYLLPIVTYEKENVHFETRYNYEDFETISVFVGRKFILSDKYDFYLTPMLGGAGGKTDGVVPALEFSFSFEKLTWYSEQEYLIDINNKHDSFFYIWSDLSYELLDWLYAGLSMQRLTPYKSTYDLDFGVFTGFHYKKWDVIFYNYALDEDDTMQILSLSFAF